MSLTAAALVAGLSTAAALKGWVVEHGKMEGTLRGGVVIRDVRVAGPGFEARIPVLRARARLTALLSGRIQLEDVELERPEALFAPDRRGAAREPQASGTGPATAGWSLDVRRWTVREGRIRLAGVPERLSELAGVEAAGSAAGGVVVVERVFARAAGIGLTGSGRASAAPLAVTARLRATGGGLEGSAWASWRPSGGKGWAELSGPDFSASLSGTLSGSGEAAGAWRARWTGRGPAAGAVSSGTLAGPWRKPRLAGFVALGSAARVDFEGTAASHALEVRAATGSVRASASGEGRFEAGQWRADWRAMSAQIGPGVRAARPFSTTLARGRFSVDGLELEDGAGRAALELERRDGVWTRARLTVRGLDSRPWIAAGAWPALAAGLFDAEVQLEGARARVRRLEWRPQTGRVHVEGLVPMAPGKSWAGLELEARVDGVGLEPFLGASREIAFERPRLDGALSVRASTAGPVLSGELVASAARAAHASSGVAIEKPRVAFAAEGERLIVRSASLATGRGGKVDLKGSLSREGPDLALAAERVAFDFRDGVKGSADAALRLTGWWRAPEASGEILVRKAEYRPAERRKKEEAAGLALSTPAAPGARAPARLAYDVRVRAEDGVWFKDKQTAIEAKGEVRVRGAGGAAPEIKGAAETVRGQISYFGRVFRVDRARAVFAGESPPDPALDAESEWVDPRTRTRVRMRLTGTAKHPKLDLSSEPPMDQRDILSFLAFGRPLYEVGQNKSAATTEQAAALVADYVAQGVGRYLPVDLFNVKLTENQKADVSVGRYVTKNLFITYGQTFEDRGEKRVSADYRLSDQWSLQSQSFGGGRYVLDLLFNYGIR